MKKQLTSILLTSSLILTLSTQALATDCNELNNVRNTYYKTNNQLNDLWPEYEATMTSIDNRAYTFKPILEMKLAKLQDLGNKIFELIPKQKAAEKTYQTISEECLKDKI